MWTLKEMMIYELDITPEDAEEILKEFFEEIEE